MNTIARDTTINNKLIIGKLLELPYVKGWNKSHNKNYLKLDVEA